MLLSRQASYYDKLFSSGLLTPPEAQLLKWAQSEQPAIYRARFVGSTAAMEKYRKGTAVEALVSFGMTCTVCLLRGTADKRRIATQNKFLGV